MSVPPKTNCRDLRISESVMLSVGSELYSDCGPIPDIDSYEYPGSPNVFYWRLVADRERDFINLSGGISNDSWNLKQIASPSNVNVVADPSEGSCNYREAEGGEWSLGK